MWRDFVLFWAKLYIISWLLGFVFHCLGFIVIVHFYEMEELLEFQIDALNRVNHRAMFLFLLKVFVELARAWFGMLVAQAAPGNFKPACPKRQNAETPN